MKLLGLIPARGGSKRVPKKNTKSLGGLPLIAWTIRAAQQSGVCMDVLVSTDDAEIAMISAEYGATVPGLRPAELATDTVSSVDVALHALSKYEFEYGSVDGLILLQPTSPFRTASTIQRAAQMFMDGGGKHSIISVSSSDDHPAWSFRINDKGDMQPFVDWESLGKRSQDLEPVYTLDGAIYIISPKLLRLEHRLISSHSRAIVTANRIEAIDIDTELDWLVAEAALSRILGSC